MGTAVEMKSGENDLSDNLYKVLGVLGAEAL